MAEPAQQGLPQDKIVDQPKPEAMQMKQGDGMDAVNALAAGDTVAFKQSIQNMLNNITHRNPEIEKKIIKLVGKEYSIIDKIKLNLTYMIIKNQC